jgi:hypothetical protein
LNTYVFERKTCAKVEQEILDFKNINFVDFKKYKILHASKHIKFNRLQKIQELILKLHELSRP